MTASTNRRLRADPGLPSRRPRGRPAGLRDAARARRRHRGRGRVRARVRGDCADSCAPADVAVLDARLPDGTGIEVCRTSASVDPEIGPHPHVVRRRRGAVRRDHGRRLRLHPQAGPRQDLVGAVRHVAAGHSLIDPAAHRAGARPGPQRRRRPRPSSPSLTEQELQAARADRRGADQPADRRADVPGREDGQELRVQHARPSSGWSAVPRRRCSPLGCCRTVRQPLSLTARSAAHAR